MIQLASIPEKIGYWISGWAAKCAICQTVFLGRRGATYCSRNCAQKAYFARRKAKA